jgi:adenylate cyclase
MGIEIERKFLVRGTFSNPAFKSTRIIQTYLSKDPQRIVRIRKAGERAFISVKSGLNRSGLERGEWEYEIPVREADELMDISLPGKIDKTRYYVPYGSHTIEVDVFHHKNEGLVIAEIELSSEDEEYEKPEWLGEEVTGDPAYYNVNLVK